MRHFKGFPHRSAENAPGRGLRRKPEYLVNTSDKDASHWDNALDRPAYRFVVDDVDALYAEWLAAGALPATSTSPYRKPATSPWGTREFHLRDPDGNALQFCDQ